MARNPLFRDFVTDSGILTASSMPELDRIELALKQYIAALPLNHVTYTKAELSAALCDWANLLSTASRVSTCEDVPHDYSDLYTLANTLGMHGPPLVLETAYQVIRRCHITYLHIAVCLRFNQLRRMEEILLEQQLQIASILGMHQPMGVA